MKIEIVLDPGELDRIKSGEGFTMTLANGQEIVLRAAHPESAGAGIVEATERAVDMLKRRAKKTRRRRGKRRRNKHHGNYGCECGRSFSTQHALDVHKGRSHKAGTSDGKSASRGFIGDPPKLLCRPCGVKFAGLAEQENHQRDKHGVKIFKGA